jgi:hypothetical protein
MHYIHEAFNSIPITIWSPILREKQNIGGASEHCVRTTFGPNRDEIKEDWRKMHNEELRNFYSSQNTTIK